MDKFWYLLETRTENQNSVLTTALKLDYKVVKPVLESQLIVEKCLELDYEPEMEPVSIIAQIRCKQHPVMFERWLTFPKAKPLLYKQLLQNTAKQGTIVARAHAYKTEWLIPHVKAAYEFARSQRAWQALSDSFSGGWSDEVLFGYGNFGLKIAEKAGKDLDERDLLDMLDE